MREKCNCGGEFVYAKSDHSYFSGTYLKCSSCQETAPSEKVIVPLDIPNRDKIFTKSDFGKLIGAKPQSVDSMVNSGRVKVVIFAKKEFIYYDK